MGTPTVVLADPSVTSVDRWLNVTDHKAYLSGYPDGLFGSDHFLTRAQVTTIVNNMLGRAADRDYVLDHQEQLNQFNDLSKTHWAYFQIMEATNAHDYTKSDGIENWR